MLRYVIYVGFAVILGVAVMMLPLVMIGYRNSLVSNVQPQRNEAENTFTSPEATVSKRGFSNETVGGYERAAANMIASIPHAMLIFLLGVTVASAVFLLAKQKLL